MRGWTEEDTLIALGKDSAGIKEVLHMLWAELKERPYEDGLAAFFAKERVNTAIALGMDADTDAVY